MENQIHTSCTFEGGTATVDATQHVFNIYFILLIENRFSVNKLLMDENVGSSKKNVVSLNLNSIETARIC